MSASGPLTMEEISPKNLAELTHLVLRLWPECNYEEEFQNGLGIINSPTETTFIASINGIHVGFIQLALRTDYVDGTTSSPVLYVEGIYVDPDYRKNGVAQLLIKKAEQWGIRKGCSEMASDTALTNQQSIQFHKAVGFDEVSRLVTFRKNLKN